MKTIYTKDVLLAVRDKNFKKKLYLFVTSSLLTLAILLMSLYFITPLSRTNSVRLKGEHAYSSEYISGIAMPTKQVFLPTFRKQRSVDLLNANPLIEEAEIHVTPFNLEVDYQDIVPAFYFNEKRYLTSGEIVPNHPLLPPEICGMPSEEFLNRLPRFAFGGEVPTENQNRKAAFSNFIGVDPLMIIGSSQVVMKSSETFYVYYKDDTEDFYYRFLIPSSRLDYFMNKTRIDLVKKVVHGNLDLFKSRLKNDKIDSLDIKVSAWVSYVNKNRFEEE